MTTRRRPALLRLLPYYRPYRGQVAIGLSAVIVASALASIIPSLLNRGIDAIHALLVADVGTRGPAPSTPGDAWRTLLPIAGVMLVTAVASGVLRFVMRNLLNGISRKIETDLRRDLFARLVRLDPGWYVRWRTGDLMARLTNDLGAIRMAAGPAVMYLVNTVAGAAFAMVMMMRISVSLTLWALLPMVGLPVLMIRLGRVVHRRFEAVQSQFSDLTTRAQENLAGVRVVRAYRQEEAESLRFQMLGERYLGANMELARLNGLMNPGFALLAGLGAAVTIGVGGRQLIAGAITVGGYVAFTIYLGQLTWPLIALGWTTNLFQRGSASMKRVLDLLDALPILETTETTAGRLTLPANVQGRSIEFRDVWFRYPDTGSEPTGTAGTVGMTQTGGMTGMTAESRMVLKGVSFRVEAGATLAIVGATGSGKSALLDLIPRLFDPQRGEILIDDIPLRALDLDGVRREIGYVPQESLLFSETVGDNVAYGLAPQPIVGGAEPTSSQGGPGEQPEVVEATEIAQLSETIAGLPDRFATKLGERGINLSGGQKQRTAIARALARRPRIVLLDDALSAVDTHTEAAILSGLRGALSGRTAVIASHRVSTVRDADLIIVLDDGEIVERGTHDELMARGERYARLLRRQQLLDDIEAGEVQRAS